MSETAQVSERTKQAESSPGEWDWVDRTIWTERRLAALGNGVKGNKGFSLIDKVYRPSTLQAAWEQVRSNRGAAGIDRPSIESFAANAQRYLDELAKDLEGYVDSISPPLLNERIEQRISDGRLLELLAGWLQQDIVKGQERWIPAGDTPQGAVISPLRANIHLHCLDKTMLRLGYRMVRYADDFVILCRRAEQAHAALAEVNVNVWVDANGLTLHLDKIREKTRRTRGGGRCRADHQRWPNAYFAALGRFTMTEARRLASQSR